MGEGMKAYYGTKRVEAEPAREDDRSNPMLAQAAREGYRVRYEDGYESWSPKAAFEAAYKPETCMGFEGALAALKAGRKVTRAAWLTAWSVAAVELRRGYFRMPGEEGFPFGMETEDLLAEDWTVVEG
jgi:hypothetical protein